MARCGCGASGGGTVVNGPNTTVTGSGTPANPYQIAAVTNCDEVRGCLTSSSGLAVDPTTGAITVATGPGLLGVGSTADKVRANVAAWTYPGPVSGAQNVFTDPSTGQLKSPPIQVMDFVALSVSRTYADLPVTTGGSDVDADVFAIPLANPDPNRSCIVVIEREVKVRFTLPPGSTASFAMDGADCGRQWNMGSSSVTGAGVQVTRMFKQGTLGPSGTGTYNLHVGTLNGTGGSTYSQINVSVRVLYLAQ